MITIRTIHENVLEKNFESYAVFLEAEYDAKKLEAVAQKLFPSIETTLRGRCFTAGAGSHLELTIMHHDKPVGLVLLGLGKRKQGKLDVENYRRAVGRLVRYTETHKLKDVGLLLPHHEDFGITLDRLAQETATILHKASYHFDTFITEPSCKLSFTSEVMLGAEGADEKLVKEGVERGIAIAQAINLARYWCDMPPSDLTPTILAQHAENIAKTHNLKSTIFTESDIISMGMGGIYGVSRGSVEEARLAILEYKTDKPNAPTLALVGKGITFDSGGLSIKPAVSMETMKDDMAGAAVVIATMQVLAQFKPHINVIALAPMTENMISGAATKPGDILRFYNGKTAEVKNTDAEGRLILADALSYAIANYKLDAIIDIATLTGSCAQALGPFYAGLMSQHEELADRVTAAAKISGDKVWPLPMNDDYKPAIRSDVADLSNIGTARYSAGAITAAFFLQSFVGNVPWVHLDVAGTAFGVPDMTYLRPGATGFGIRLFVDLVMNWE